MVTGCIAYPPHHCQARLAASSRTITKVPRITTNENAVVNVPSAYSTGVVTLVVIPKISSGKVLSLPAVSSVRANSSYDSVKPNRAMPITLGAIIGSTTCQNDCQGVAPWSRAASSQARLNRLNTANMISIPNGSVQVNCAPNAEL